MKSQKLKMARRSGQSLVGMLVTLGIIIAAAGIYLSVKGKNPDGSESTKTALRRSVDLAQEIALSRNLNQISQIIGMYKGDNEGKVPPTFEELKRYAKFPAEMWINPVDEKPLDYNPATGLMIVQPYEGMSRQIAQMAPAPDAAAGSTPEASAPSTPGAPVTPVIPNIPNSGAAPPVEDSE